MHRHNGTGIKKSREVDHSHSFVTESANGKEKEM